MRVDFSGITFELPAGWADITDDLPCGSPPTLAKPSGVGAIQFSIAKYRSGDAPNINIDNLQLFLAEFCDNNLMDHRNFEVQNFEDILCIGTTSDAEDQFLSAWYLSNGRDVVFVTYTGEKSDLNEVKREFDDAKRIVCSIYF